MSCILLEWHVDRSSAASVSNRTRYVEHAAVAAKKSCPARPAHTVTRSQRAHAASQPPPHTHTHSAPPPPLCRRRTLHYSPTLLSLKPRPRSALPQAPLHALLSLKPPPRGRKVPLCPVPTSLPRAPVAAQAVAAAAARARSIAARKTARKAARKAVR